MHATHTMPLDCGRAVEEEEIKTNVAFASIVSRTILVKCCSSRTSNRINFESMANFFVK